jgi:hypothetical protein
MSESSSMPFQLIKTGTGTQVQPIPRACPESFRKEERPRVFLTSVRIPDDHIWANGLFQNVYVIYKMMELLGFEPWLLVDNNENNKDAELHKKFRLTDFKTYMQNPFKVIGYIEIAMSCDPSIRKYFRSTGAKICKLYLGNILNIDIETITYYGGMNFSHHVAGELDEIWVSPHYDIHGEYAGSINGLCGKTRIAPYVWDPMFIQELGHVYNGAQFGINSPRTFVIMEPNISFQKNSFIPIMALEAYYRRHPERVQEVIVINGHKFRDNPYFIQSVAPNLTLIKAGKLQLMPRAHIVNLARAIPHAIILQHQVNNGYNYSFLEWMTMGFPLVHNVAQFKEFGYYYDANDFEAAATQVENIVANHEVNKDSYAAHTRQLTWRFSIYNPENSTVWKRMMLEK